jgi:hypothetical protein
VGWSIGAATGGGGGEIGEGRERNVPKYSFMYPRKHIIHHTCIPEITLLIIA